MKRAKRKSRSLTSRGSSLITVLLVALIIGAGIFFTNGLFTDTNKTPLDTTAHTPSAIQFNDNRVVLQLKTLNFESCGDTAALGFLVDQSGSMNYGTPGSTKEDKLKYALNVFATSFPSEGIAGLQTFSDHQHAQFNVPFNYFKNIKTLFLNIVNNRMTALNNGGTSTKDAFILEKQLLDAARVKYPENKFNLVFISDGIPETSEGNNCGPSGPGPAYCGVHPDGTCRCFDPNQDPTTVAAQIRNSGVKIYTIAYVNDENEMKFRDLLKTLMTNVASSPSDYFEAPKEGDITGILQQIVTKVCKS